MTRHESDVIRRLIFRIEELDNIGDYGIGRDDDAVGAARKLLPVDETAGVVDDIYWKVRQVVKNSPEGQSNQKCRDRWPWPVKG